MKIQDMAGVDLGTRISGYSKFDAILYALAVGARATELELVYERDLHVLPTYALALSNWVTEAAGELGVYDRNRTLHASQSLTMRAPLPPEGKVETKATVGAVYDKGSAAMVQIDASTEYYDATYTIFVPGFGGWGGERGPSAGSDPGPGEDAQAVRSTMTDEQATLYRLTGDVHPVHVDPEVAAANELEGPIVHGLCTLGFAARDLGSVIDAKSWELKEVQARFSQPVMPGSTLESRAYDVAACSVRFQTSVDGQPVLKGGQARF